MGMDGSMEFWLGLILLIILITLTVLLVILKDLCCGLGLCCATAIKHALLNRGRMHKARSVIAQPRYAPQHKLTSSKIGSRYSEAVEPDLLSSSQIWVQMSPNGPPRHKQSEMLRAVLPAHSAERGTRVGAARTGAASRPVSRHAQRRVVVRTTGSRLADYGNEEYV